jgi:hypothetical protein
VDLGIILLVTVKKQPGRGSQGAGSRSFEAGASWRWNNRIMPAHVNIGIVTVADKTLCQAPKHMPNGRITQFLTARIVSGDGGSENWRCPSIRIIKMLSESYQI